MKTRLQARPSSMRLGVLIVLGLSPACDGPRPLRTVPPGLRPSPLAPASRAVLEERGAVCAPNERVCSYRSAGVDCALTFDAAELLAHLACTVGELSYQCVRPNGTYFCNWLDDLDCAEVYSSDGTFESYLCGDVLAERIGGGNAIDRPEADPEQMIDPLDPRPVLETAVDPEAEPDPAQAPAPAPETEPAPDPDPDPNPAPTPPPPSTPPSTPPPASPPTPPAPDPKPPVDGATSGPVPCDDESAILMYWRIPAIHMELGAGSLAGDGFCVGTVRFLPATWMNGLQWNDAHDQVLSFTFNGTTSIGTTCTNPYHCGTVIYGDGTSQPDYCTIWATCENGFAQAISYTW